MVGLFRQTLDGNVLHFGLFLKHLEFFVNWAGFLLHTHVHITLSFVLLELVSEALKFLSADFFCVELKLESMKVLGQVVNLLEELYVLLSNELV